MMKGRHWQMAMALHANGRSNEHAVLAQAVVSRRAARLPREGAGRDTAAPPSWLSRAEKLRGSI